MSESIQFGSKLIVYKIKYTKRKSLGITITPNAQVLINAPENAAEEKIKSIVRKKAPWIIRQQSFFLSFFPKITERRYVGGETHLYAGRQYMLKVHTNKVESVKLKGRFIEVSVIKKDHAERLVKDWYQQLAKEKFKVIAKPIIEKFKKYKVYPTSIVVRSMATRWGSCTPKGKIILNPELVKAPKGCIEYVIIHELCHLVHYDHTQKFIGLQTKEMPDWEKWKMRLERLLA